jgi:hypothetical protein
MLCVSTSTHRKLDLSQQSPLRHYQSGKARNNIYNIQQLIKKSLNRSIQNSSSPTHELLEAYSSGAADQQN